MKAFYYERLSDEEKKYYKEICKGLSNHWQTITLHGLTDKDKLMRCTEAVRYDCMDFYYVNLSLITSRTYMDYIEYLPIYIYSGKELEQRNREIANAVQCILNSMPVNRNMSVYDKCLWLHNYIARNCTYNDDAIKDGADIKSAYSIEGVLLEKTAVCQGIAMAYKYLCGKLGIDAIVARGNSLKPGSKNYERHAWNIITVGDHAIHIDATWDMCLTDKTGPIRYDYFFLPDIEMMRDHQYVKYPICRNRNINMFSYTNTFFESIEDMKRYIDAEEKRINKQEFYLYFKTKNRKESKEEIVKELGDYIAHKTNRGFSSTYRVNEAQSIFVFHFTYT